MMLVLGKEISYCHRHRCFLSLDYLNGVTPALEKSFLFVYIMSSELESYCVVCWIIGTLLMVSHIHNSNYNKSSKNVLRANN